MKGLAATCRESQGNPERLAFRGSGEMQPFLTRRPAGRKPGDKYPLLTNFLSSHLCVCLPFAKLHQMPEGKEPVALEGQLPGAQGRVRGSAAHRGCCAGAAWRRAGDPMDSFFFLIINFHLHLKEGGKSGRIRQFILCKRGKSLENVLREVIHSHNFFCWTIFQTQKSTIVV